MRLQELLQNPYKGFDSINRYIVDRQDLRVLEGVQPIVNKLCTWTNHERYRPLNNPAKRVAKIIAILKQANCDLYQGSNGGGSAYSYIEIAIPIQQLPLDKLPELMKYTDVVTYHMDGRNVLFDKHYINRIFIQFSVKYMNFPWWQNYELKKAMTFSRMSKWGLFKFYNDNTCRWNLSFIAKFNNL